MPNYTKLKLNIEFSTRFAPVKNDPPKIDRMEMIIWACCQMNVDMENKQLVQLFNTWSFRTALKLVRRL